MNIVRENFRKLPKEELNVDGQIIPFKGKSNTRVINLTAVIIKCLHKLVAGVVFVMILYCTGTGESPEYVFRTNIATDLCEIVPHSVKHKICCDSFLQLFDWKLNLKE